MPSFTILTPLERIIAIVIRSSSARKAVQPSARRRCTSPAAYKESSVTLKLAVGNVRASGETALLEQNLAPIACRILFAASAPTNRSAHAPHDYRRDAVF